MAATNEKILTSSMSHTGSIRKLNEDALIAIPASGLWAVADGMGGHDAGDYASRCLIGHLYDAASIYKGKNLVEQVPIAIQNANQELFDLSKKENPHSIIGTTIVVLVLEGEKYHCFWSGDSRCYLLRDNQLQPITRDHTEAEELLAQGYTIEEFPDPSTAAMLTYAVGVDKTAHIDYTTDYIYEADRFLLCTDGITKIYSDSDIARKISENNIDQINQQFLTGALDAGAPDNLSSIIVSL